MVTSKEIQELLVTPLRDALSTLEFDEDGQEVVVPLYKELYVKVLDTEKWVLTKRGNLYVVSGVLLSTLEKLAEEFDIALNFNLSRQVERQAQQLVRGLEENRKENILDVS